MRNFVNIDYAHLSRFCKCAEKLIEARSFVNVKLAEGQVSMIVGDGRSIVEYKGQPYSSEGAFDVWVRLEKLVTVCKKLYEGSILMEETRTRLFIEEDNIKAKLPLADSPQDDLSVALANPIEISGDRAMRLVTALKECNTTVSDADFRGLLIDSTSSIERVCKFSRSAIAIVNGKERLFTGGRFVIAPRLVKAVESFATEVSSVLTCGNLFGFRLTNGVSVYSCILVDTLPHSYIEELKLKDDWLMVDEENVDKYVFKRDDLVAALEVVLAVAASDRSFVTLKALGKARGSEDIVWCAYCKDSEECEIEEHFKCLEFTGSALPNFGLNGKSFVHALKTREETVTLYTRGRSPVMLSDAEGGRLMLLIKTAG